MEKATLKKRKMKKATQKKER